MADTRQYRHTNEPQRPRHGPLSSEQIRARANGPQPGVQPNTQSGWRAPQGEPTSRWRPPAGLESAPRGQTGWRGTAQKAVGATKNALGTTGAAVGKGIDRLARGGGAVQAGLGAMDLYENGLSSRGSDNLYNGVATVMAPGVGLAGSVLANLRDRGLQAIHDNYVESDAVKYPGLTAAGIEYAKKREAEQAAAEAEALSSQQNVQPEPEPENLAQLPKAAEANMPGQPNVAGLSRTPRLNVTLESAPEVRELDDEGYARALKDNSRRTGLAQLGGFAALQGYRAKQQKGRRDDLEQSQEVEQRNATRMNDAAFRQAGLQQKAEELDLDRQNKQAQAVQKFNETQATASKDAVAQYGTLLERTFQTTNEDGKIVPDLDERAEFERYLKESNPDYFSIKDAGEREALFSEVYRQFRLNKVANRDALDPNLGRQVYEMFGGERARADDRQGTPRGIRSAGYGDAATSRDVGFLNATLGTPVFDLENGATILANTNNVQERATMIDAMMRNSNVTAEQIRQMHGKGYLTAGEARQMLQARGQ